MSSFHFKEHKKAVFHQNKRTILSLSAAICWFSSLSVLDSSSEEQHNVMRDTFQKLRFFELLQTKELIQFSDFTSDCLKDPIDYRTCYLINKR